MSLLVLGLAGCASGGYPVVVGAPGPEVVVVEDGRRGSRVRDVYRQLRVPRGHYPPPGACRVWYAGRPPGHQPRPSRCDRLYGRVPRGAFILYNGNAWDSDYDWARYERRHRGRVPRVIVTISATLRR